MVSGLRELTIWFVPELDEIEIVQGPRLCGESGSEGVGPIVVAAIQPCAVK